MIGTMNHGWIIYYIEEGNSIGVPQKFKGEINSKFHESSLVFSTDYKNDTIVYFTRNSYFRNQESFQTTQEGKEIENLSNLKIYKGEKVNGKWKVTRSIRTNADHYSNGHPSVNHNMNINVLCIGQTWGLWAVPIFITVKFTLEGVLESQLMQVRL